MREAYKRVLDSIEAGYDFWFLLPQLEKLSHGFCVDKGEDTTEIFFHGPGPMAAISDMVEIVNGKEYPRAAYPELYREFVIVIRAWANEPETPTETTSTDKSEFRKRDKQALADWIDGYRKDNSPINRPTLARKYFRYLRQGNKKSSYLKGKPVNESKSIEAITRTIGEIDSERAARNQK